LRRPGLRLPHTGVDREAIATNERSCSRLLRGDHSTHLRTVGQCDALVVAGDGHVDDGLQDARLGIEQSVHGGRGREGSSSRESTMKSMTCKQLGGACEQRHAGHDANDIIHAQDRHLREVVAAGDADHRSAFAAMKGRWKHPVSGMKWYRQVHRDFDAQPFDTEAG
jgi:hypothetical protein